MHFIKRLCGSWCAALWILAMPLTATGAELTVARPAADAAQPLPAGMLTTPVLQAARVIDLPLTVQHGSWSFPADGTAVWRLQLRTADATYVGLQLQDLQLPPHSRVTLSSDQGQSGPFSDRDRGGDNTLWLPLVHGSDAVLEIVLPAASMSELRFGETTMQYGVVPLDGRRPQTKAEGDAGACHNDVACPVGDDWRAAIDATVLLVIANRNVCNGVLLNNSRGDGAPLIITADHCGIRADGDGDGFPAASVTAIFNFQSQQCDRSVGVSSEDRITGATLLYRDSRSDTSLIRLDRAPPAVFNAHYAGWDATGNGASRGSGVHHPAGDLKKISLFDQPVQKEIVTITDGAIVGSRDQTVDAWRVAWSDGVTEFGSSGSGLWTPQQQLIGVLSGGRSACGRAGFFGLGGSNDVVGPDFYGRLEVAFTRAGALGTPIQRFLDPTGSGVLRLSQRTGGNAPPATGGSGGSTGTPESGGDGGGSLTWIALITLFGGVLLRRRGPA